MVEKKKTFSSQLSQRKQLGDWPFKMLVQCILFLSSHAQISPSSPK
jgi:hypothetical protein